MSWLFGVKPSEPPQLPIDMAIPGAPEPPSGSGGGGKKDGSKEGSSRMAYSFDSEALERAAKAAKQLEMSGNAREALELSKMQEMTRQKELENQTKMVEAQIEEMKVQQRKVAEVERRKTMEEETKQAKFRVEYSDQLARKRQQDELAMQAKMQEENLRRQEESIKKQEALRKATIEHELALKHKYDLDRVNAETMARAQADRENRDVNLERLRADHQERRVTVMEAIKTGGSVLGAGAQAFITDWGKILAAAGGLSLLAVGVYSAKRGTSVVGNYFEARLGKPSLVRDTSRLGPLDALRQPWRATRMIFARAGPDPLTGVVLKPSLEAKLRDIAITTQNTKRNRGLYRNVLFYGPPGTGKTMFAKSLAMHSGLDYAILTGGDVAPMGRDGVSAMHKVFDWAHTSRKGLLLFVDEADAFLRKRSTEQISEDMRATLNAFLFRTGEQSARFMLVVASNQPEQFDWAVNDRLDEMVQFDLPGLPERERILLQYFRRYIADPATTGARWQRLKLAQFDWIQKCTDIARKTEGLSGRELSKMVIAWQASAYASEDGVLRPEMIDEKVEDIMKQHRQKMEWLEAERRLLDARNVQQQQQQELSAKTLASARILPHSHESSDTKHQQAKQETHV